MDIQRLDEIRELFAHNLKGSGMNVTAKKRAQELFDRVGDDLAHRINPPKVHQLTQTESGADRAATTVSVLGTPRTAAQTEAVIAASQGNHVNAVGTTYTPAAEPAKPTTVTEA